MPLYNKEREIGRAITSVLAQTFGDFELLVVDDGSTDGGPDIVAACIDPRIRMIRQANGGVSTARNRGIVEAQAELVAFLDADDEWLPEFLGTIMKLRDYFSTCRVFATSYTFSYTRRSPRQTLLRGGLPSDCIDGILADYFSVALHSDPPLCSSAVTVDKRAILEIGGFPVGVIAGEDLLTWARLAVRFDIAYCRLPLANFWAPIAMDDRPPRIPQQPDMVAQGLTELLETASLERSQGLREYIGLWHRMRAVVYLKLNWGTYARHEIRNAIKSNGMNLRLCIMQAISYLPGKLPSRVQLALSRGVSLTRTFTMRRLNL